MKYLKVRLELVVEIIHKIFYNFIWMLLHWWWDTNIIRSNSCFGYNFFFKEIYELIMAFYKNFNNYHNNLIDIHLRHQRTGIFSYWILILLQDQKNEWNINKFHKYDKNIWHIDVIKFFLFENFFFQWQCFNLPIFVEKKIILQKLSTSGK